MYGYVGEGDGDGNGGCIRRETKGHVWNDLWVASPGAGVLTSSVPKGLQTCFYAVRCYWWLQVLGSGLEQVAE